MIKHKTLIAAGAAAVLFVAGGAVFAADAAKPADAKPAQAKPAEAKPAQAKPAEAKPAKPANSVMAVVNGRKITSEEFDLTLNSYMASLAQRMGGQHSGKMDPNDKVKKELLNQLIDREVLFSEIEKNKFDDVDNKVKEEFEQAKKGYGSDEEFKKALKTDGIDETTLKKLIKRRVLFAAYVDKFIAPKIVISDEESKKFYDENAQYFETQETVSCSHILIATKKEDTPEKKAEAKAKAEAIRKRIEGGEDFAKIAKEVSDCPSKEKGGDLGSFGRGQMVKPFEEAAFGLEIGKLSNVVETEFGYHVIKSTAHQKADKVPYDTVKERIVGHLKEKALNKAIRDKVDELKKTAKIEISADLK